MNPLTDLAHALHGSPGAYAVLLGSGVSRAAEIKTGWQITLDLIEQLAVGDGGEPPDDPEAWWRQTYDTDPDYSAILQKLAPTQDERRDRLSRYFEPDEEDRAEGRKLPTDAHGALADLVDAGAIRIILTTNFDQLIEQALTDAGVPYDVWSTPDDIRGGRPLSHGQVVIVKLHGDYHDHRIRNTTGELERYPEELNALLGQILDEFGLVVCGWSGVWDEALRAAIRQAPNRRYRMFWAARGDLEDEAQRLIDHRDGRVVPIEDADRFFGTLRDTVLALQERDARHPDDVDAAVAVLKRLLPDERDRIRLEDFVMGEARRLHGRLGPDHYPVEGQQPTVEDLVARARRYEADAETLAHLLATLAFHADRPQHVDLVVRALELTGNPAGGWTGIPVLLNVRQYPALVCLYAAGLGAVAAGNWPLLRTVLVDPQWHGLNEQAPLLDAVHPYRVLEEQVRVMQMLATGDPDSKRLTPVGDHLHEHLHGPLMPLVDTPRRYDETFDRFEYLTGVVAHRLQVRPYTFESRLRWVHQYAHDVPPATWARQHAATLAPVLLDGLTDDPAQAWDAAVVGFEDGLAQMPRR